MKDSNSLPAVPDVLRTSTTSKVLHPELAENSAGSSDAVTDLRHRDLWMTYVARAILGKKPNFYPNLDDDLTDTNGHLPTYHYRSNPLHLPRRTRKIGRMSLHPELPRAKTHRKPLDKEVERAPFNADDTEPSIVQILELCDNDTEPRSYDLVLDADRTMVRDHGPGGRRIADNVCKKMLEIIDDLASKQRKASRNSQLIKRRRISLRCVLCRFCKDAAYLPRSLYILNPTIPPAAVVYAGGSCADVYRVEHKGRLLAFKSFRIYKDPGLQDDGVTKSAPRVLTEAVLWSCLRNDNLLPFLGVHKQTHYHTEILYAVSPWMANEEIKCCMQDLDDKGLPIPHIRWIRQIASGLQYLHDERIVHGGIHGGNLLVDEHLNVHIADFALFRLSELTKTKQMSISTRGQEWWTAPEIVAQGEKATYTTDVWSFGCACLLIWTGRGPFDRCGDQLQLYLELVAKSRTPEGTPPMDAFHMDVSGASAAGTFVREEIALKCWCRKPEDRPTMEQLRSVIEERLGPLENP